MTVDQLEATQKLDTSGTSCPVPLLKTKKALKALKAGDILEVICTDPGSERDIPKFANKGGNKYIGKTESGNSISHFIEKG